MILPNYKLKLILPCFEYYYSNLGYKNFVVDIRLYNYFMVSVFGWPDPRRRVTLHAFLNSSNIPKCLDQAIQTQKP